MAVYQVELAANKSDGVRSVAYVSNAGLMCIVDRRTKKGTCRTRCYQVSEFPCDCRMPGRCFVVRKGDGERYECFLSRNGQDHQCSCKRACYCQTGPCVHVEALKALVAAGAMDDVSGMPDSPYPSPEQIAADAGEDVPF